MYKEEESEEEVPSRSYIANEVGNDDRCAHFFKRVSPYKVECTKCHVGLMDDPDNPAPIESLNEYYSMDTVQRYNKWL